jgi:hypothetical protein
VADAVLPADDDSRPPDAAAIADRFTDALVQRMEELRVLGPESHRARAALERWLGARSG